jgi:DNA mismatch repair protein MutL
MPPAASPLPGAPDGPRPADSDPGAFAATGAEAEPFQLTPRLPTPVPGKLPFESHSFNPGGWGDQQAWGEAAAALFEPGPASMADGCSHPLSDASANGSPANGLSPATATTQIEAEQAATTLNHLGSLRPLGQLRESFILASGDDGLWIIDQHVAHERILFEKILRDRQVEKVQRQRLLMPMLVELKPAQMVVFARIAEELDRESSACGPGGGGFGAHAGRGHRTIQRRLG